MPLLTTSGRYDTAAIMRAAHAKARAKLTEQRARGAEPWAYALAFKYALRSVWIDARTYMQVAQERARYAARCCPSAPSPTSKPPVGRPA